MASLWVTVQMNKKEANESRCSGSCVDEEKIGEEREDEEHTAVPFWQWSVTFFIFLYMESPLVHLNPKALFQNAGNTRVVFEIFIQIVKRAEMELQMLLSMWESKEQSLGKSLLCHTSTTAQALVRARAALNNGRFACSGRRLRKRFFQF